MASDAYLELETRSLIGETFDDSFGMDSSGARRQGAFEIASFSFSTGQDKAEAKTAPTQTGGKTGANVSTTPSADKQKDTDKGHFTIKKPVDGSSGDIFQLCCEHTEIKWAVVTFREAGDVSRKPWLILEFSKVFVDSFGWELDPDAKDEAVKEQESITFSFGMIMIKYNPQLAGGGHDVIKMKSWNFNEHKPTPVEDWKSETW